ncbi:long-chain fatty acid--CoA ligase [Geodermatophilus sp. DSM 44513]|uniref:long-chain-fatty-acid--CoA ligase n=1 Tax=Geodermatophilus sp. DSM 44513 TaxID=1528104 RepID=UPI0028F6FF34|nr:long-chain fatty acid--CoA ligase [Geodermatophilus sp. DSM 44513]WNV77820.1 long-chain fatty acid--CoA ligase [Geodermatophilus sp. DSM 44513]
MPFDSLPEMLTAAAAEHATATAFTACLPNGMNGSLSFAAVDRAADCFAAFLREELGLAPGDRVAVQVPNCLAYPVVAFGVLKAGCVLVNTNPLYTTPELQRQYADAGVAAVVVVDLFADRLAPALPALGDPPVVLVRVTEFFPGYVAGIVRLVQRYWDRSLPAVAFPATTLADALGRGAAHLGDGDARRYWHDLRPGDLAALQYTGGTTGVSKGAVLTHGALLANVEQVLASVGDAVRPGRETVLTALPLYHVFAFTVNLLGFYRRGAHDVLIPSPRPLGNLKRALENHPVTWITGVNTLFDGLCRERWFTEHPPAQLRAAVAGGMALHGSVAQRWEQVTGVPVVEGYGLTEASPVLTFNPLDGRARAGTVGLPVPGTVLRCTDDSGRTVPAGEPGELRARGPQVMAGYWRRPEETAAVLRDGELRTGDVAVVDADGYVRLVDRTKDLVLVSGFNVYPSEVEEVLTAHPGIREAAVVGVPADGSGERVRAVVVRTDPALTAEQVRAWAAQRLAAYKVPRDVVFTDDLPKSPIGKVLRKDVRAAQAAHPAPAPQAAPPAPAPQAGG